MAANLHKIKHWKILCADYSESLDIEATWFIDPPYKESPGKGYHYSSSQIGYGALAGWAEARKGEIIYYRSDRGQEQLSLFAR